MERTLHLKFHDNLNVGMKERVRGKVKDGSYSSRDKLRKDFFHGDDLHRKSGKWNKKDRVVDKDNDHYREAVKDPETGEIIHKCKEPLSDHRGHGAAKKKLMTKGHDNDREVLEGCANCWWYCSHRGFRIL